MQQFNEKGTKSISNRLGFIQNQETSSLPTLCRSLTAQISVKQRLPITNQTCQQLVAEKKKKRLKK
jgi:hypothetical protein